MTNNGLSLNRQTLLILSLSFISFFIASHATVAFAVEGSILVPKNGDQVDGGYDVKGTVKDLPDGCVLWIAVRKGKNFWPKDKAFIVGGKNWTANVDESATQPGGSYSLVLFSVDSKGQTEISDWYRINEEQHKWPAIVGGIKGATALDSVDVRRK
jgi:hypothetical protein